MHIHARELASFDMIRRAGSIRAAARQLHITASAVNRQLLQLEDEVGTPLFEPDRFLIKFHNLWTIEAPEGYALLFTHPFNRFDLPFTTLTGQVDCDRYHDNWIHFPAHWHDMNFSGVLPKGTPVELDFLQIKKV